jgi:hypothetical protein
MVMYKGRTQHFLLFLVLDPDLNLGLNETLGQVKQAHLDRAVTSFLLVLLGQDCNGGGGSGLEAKFHPHLVCTLEDVVEAYLS